MISRQVLPALQAYRTFQNHIYELKTDTDIIEYSNQKDNSKVQLKLKQQFTLRANDQSHCNLVKNLC